MRPQVTGWSCDRLRCMLSKPSETKCQNCRAGCNWAYTSHWSSPFVTCSSTRAVADASMQAHTELAYIPFLAYENSEGGEPFLVPGCLRTKSLIDSLVILPNFRRAFACPRAGEILCVLFHAFASFSCAAAEASTSVVEHRFFEVFPWSFDYASPGTFRCSTRLRLHLFCQWRAQSNMFLLRCLPGPFTVLDLGLSFFPCVFVSTGCVSGVHLHAWVFLVTGNHLCPRPRCLSKI